MRTLHTFALASLLLAPIGAGCTANGPGDGATETNVSRVPCSTDAQCGGDGLRCLPRDGGVPDGGMPGFCEVRDTTPPEE